VLRSRGHQFPPENENVDVYDPVVPVLVHNSGHAP
jgi:hypothetical protein